MSASDKRLLKRMTQCTKNIYNSSLYCSKRWYDFYRILTKRYADNVNNHLQEFSPHDRLIVAKYFKSTQDSESLNVVLTNSHKSEKELLQLKNPDANVLQVLEEKEKSVLNDFQYTKESIESISDEEIREYYTYMVDPVKKEGAIRQMCTYKTNIVAAITHKIEHTKPPKDDDNEKGESESTTKLKCIEKTNLIITSSPCFDIINSYVTNTCRSYRQISAQAAQQTIKKLKAAYDSFFELQKDSSLRSKSRPPKYLTDNHYPLIFQQNSFKYVTIKSNNKKKKYYRLALGTLMKKTYTSKLGQGFLFIPAKINNTYRDAKISEIEVVPNHHGRWFDIRYKYSLTPKVETKDKAISISNFASIDLGVVNLVTLYSPNSNLRPYIINGRELTHCNYKTKCLLAKLSRKYKKYTESHYRVIKKRQHQMHNFMHQASSAVVKYCKTNNITQLVVGYNKNWKTNVNIGRNNNDRFYKIPFRAFVDMLFYKCLDNDINMVESNEAYTSKCDALNDEHVGHHEQYSGNRSKRGIFVSGKVCPDGKKAMINADVNGAINILRKYIDYKYANFTDLLREQINDSIQLIKSPLKTNIVRLTHAKTMDTVLAQCVVTRVCDTTQLISENTVSNTILVDLDA